MITSIIYWSVRNRFLVLLATFLITGLGLYSLSKTLSMRYRICPMCKLSLKRASRGKRHKWSKIRSLIP